MQLKRGGSQFAHEQKHGLPEATKWRHLDEASVPKDDTIVAIPEAHEGASELFDELKAIIYAMKVFGLFPLQRRNTGWSTLKKKISVSLSPQANYID
jgi:hypothetical protein